ncbi:MAG: hypothetical protein IPI50_09695 [Saprospiraceae bacterium]|nr:hypothetical protein [Saprospiraceae bacterium]
MQTQYSTLEVRALRFEIQSDFRLFSDCNLRPLLNPWVGFNKTVLDFRQSRIGEFPFFRQGYSIAIDDGTNLIYLWIIFFKSNCNILLSEIGMFHLQVKSLNQTLQCFCDHQKQ